MRRNLFFISTCTCVLGVLFGLRLWFTTLALPKEFAPLLYQQVSLPGTIVADPDVRAKNQQLVIEVSRNGRTTRMLAFAPLGQQYGYREHVIVSGTLTPPEPFATTAGRVFRYDHFLAKKGIFALAKRARVEEVGPPSGLVSLMANALFGVKHEFVKGLSRALPSPYAELATGLLTGDQHQLGSDVVTTLALSGLIWVVVLAGYHVTLIVRGVLALLFFLPRNFALLCAGLCVAALVFATGASAPSLRGSMMAGLALFATGTHRTYNALRALVATTIVLLLWNPLLMAYDLGFQLSLLVTLAILVGVPILEMRLLWIKSSLVREVIAVSTLAQLACLPLLVWQTGQLETWAIPANILVMAFIPLVMMMSLVAGVGGMIAAPLAPLIGLPSHVLLYYLLSIARFASTLPYANATLPPFSFGFVVLAYMLLAGVLYLLTLPGSRIASQPTPN